MFGIRTGFALSRLLIDVRFEPWSSTDYYALKLAMKVYACFKHSDGSMLFHFFI
jgi:hypothetical protein